MRRVSVAPLGLACKTGKASATSVAVKPTERRPSAQTFCVILMAPRSSRRLRTGRPQASSATRRNVQPNKPLETTLRDRARAFARRRASVEHSMLLENQKVTTRDADGLLDEIVRKTNPRLFWD
jgi:hypothetical protein